MTIAVDLGRKETKQTKTNSVDPDQTAPFGAVGSASTLFVFTLFFRFFFQRIKIHVLFFQFTDLLIL